MSYWVNVGVSCYCNTAFTNPLTNNDEGVVDVHAAKPVGSFTDVRPRIIGLHLFNTQSLL